MNQPGLCRFGTEHEKLGYNLADNTRLGYEKIRIILEGLCERFGWEPVMEGEYIIGAELDGQNVSLEPGGQFELSGAPLDTLHKTCAEVANHLYQVANCNSVLPEVTGMPCCPRLASRQGRSLLLLSNRRVDGECYAGKEHCWRDWSGLPDFGL